MSKVINCGNIGKCYTEAVKLAKNNTITVLYLEGKVSNTRNTNNYILCHANVLILDRIEKQVIIFNPDPYYQPKRLNELQHPNLCRETLLYINKHRFGLKGFVIRYLTDKNLRLNKCRSSCLLFIYDWAKCKETALNKRHGYELKM